MSKCISSKESQRYTRHLQKQGVSIHDSSSTLIKAFTPWERLGARSRRQQTQDSIANIAVQGLLVALADAPFPRFYPLNLQVSEACDKHAMMLVLDRQGPHYVLELFDSNGTLTDKDWDDFATKLSLRVRELLSLQLGEPVEFVEVREGYESVNNYGTGNCDALCLYYVAVRNTVADHEDANRIVGDKVDGARTLKINDMVRKRKSPEGI